MKLIGPSPSVRVQIWHEYFWETFIHAFLGSYWQCILFGVASFPSQYAVFACRKGSELEVWTTDDLGCFFLFVPINSFWSIAVYGVFTFVGYLWSSVYTRVKIQTMSWRCGSDEVYATGGSTTCSTILMWNMFCSKIGQELKDKNLWHPLN